MWYSAGLHFIIRIAFFATTRQSTLYCTTLRACLADFIHSYFINSFTPFTKSLKFCLSMFFTPAFFIFSNLVWHTFWLRSTILNNSASNYLTLLIRLGNSFNLVAPQSNAAHFHTTPKSFDLLWHSSFFSQTNFALYLLMFYSIHPGHPANNFSKKLSLYCSFSHIPQNSVP